MRSSDFTAEYIRHRFDYDPLTGLVRLKNSPRPKCNGRILGHHDAKGYLRMGLGNGSILVHRLVWMHYYGVWPKEQIDHVNHVRDDNRIANLRECTNAENRQNIVPQGYGKSGYLGVYPTDSATSPWKAKIMRDQKIFYLGMFASKEAAHEAYAKAKRDVHQFATTGVSVLSAGS